MAQSSKTDKGGRVEEFLRAYFMRSGFFVLRAVPLTVDGENLTDIDVWLYERPTGSSRRVQIVDAKGRGKPRAAERIFWTQGLVDFLRVDGGYVATTDNRSVIRRVAGSQGLSVLDGKDLQRILKSDKMLFSERCSEEDFQLEIKELDDLERQKFGAEIYQDSKASVITGFGCGSLNRNLKNFEDVVNRLVGRHPTSKSIGPLMRLALLSASLIALSLDFVAAQVSLRTGEERRQALLNAIRFGDIDEERGLERVRFASALIDKYAPEFGAASQRIGDGIRSELVAIPADIIVDHIMKTFKTGEVFDVAKKLEASAYNVSVPGFDALSVAEKSFIGTLLDFIDVPRGDFASILVEKPVASERNVQGSDLFWDS